MRQQLRVGAAVFALLAGISLASAQGGSQLSPQQQQSVSKGLANQPNDNAPTGYKGQVGAKIPDSVTANPMPNNVTADVPAAKNLLFVKLPDRVLLIDPDTKTIAEILLASDTTTTGSVPGEKK